MLRGPGELAWPLRWFAAQMKDGTTHLVYKPEHVVDLDSGAVVAAEAMR